MVCDYRPNNGKSSSLGTGSALLRVTIQDTNASLSSQASVWLKAQLRASGSCCVLLYSGLWPCILLNGIFKPGAYWIGSHQELCEGMVLSMTRTWAKHSSHRDVSLAGHKWLLAHLCYWTPFEKQCLPYPQTDNTEALWGQPHQLRTAQSGSLFLTWVESTEQIETCPSDAGCPNHSTSRNDQHCFALNEPITLKCLYWYSTDLKMFHCRFGEVFDHDWQPSHATILTLSKGWVSYLVVSCMELSSLYLHFSGAGLSSPL